MNQHSRSTRGTLRRLARAMAVILLLAVAGCSENEYQAPPPQAVTVAEPTVKDVTFYADYTGYTQAQESVEVRARVEGFLESMHFEPSSVVQAGQLLFVIDPRQYLAQRDQAKGELAKCQADLELAKSTLIRKQNAYKDRAVSEVDVIQAKAEKAKAEAAIEAAKASLQTAQIDLGYTQIHAPLAGRISRNMVDIGNLVGAGEKTLLTTIVDDDPIYVYFNISENDLLTYLKYASGDKDGSRHEYSAEPKAYLALALDEGYPHEGLLDYMDNTVDTSTGTIQIRGVFPNADRAIIPGFFARVRIPLGQRRGSLLIPDVAIGADQGGSYALVVDDKNVAQYRKLKLGPLEGELRVVLEGLSKGDRVIVNGLQRCRPGMVVAPQEQNATPAKATPAQAEAAKTADEK